MMPSSDAVRNALIAALRANRNPDGGWAYRPGKQSRIEPTCWALLALDRAEAMSADIEVLRAWPRDSDWMLDVRNAPPNTAFNAVAALTFLHLGGAHGADPIIARLLDSKGVTNPQSSVMRQDNSLQAWSWVEGTSSWVEPTAWSLLLLKQRYGEMVPDKVARRIQVGEAVLIDRACKVGGWNYGNSNVYGTFHASAHQH